MRRAYLDWVEARIEAHKESIPRGDLLSLADEVVTGLRVSAEGQYQLTEILLCHAVDRRLFRELKLPGYRAWLQQRAREEEAAQQVIPLPADRPLLAEHAHRAGAVEHDAERRMLAGVG
jgi:hypothetical protein